MKQWFRRWGVPVKASIKVKIRATFIFAVACGVTGLVTSVGPLVAKLEAQPIERLSANTFELTAGLALEDVRNANREAERAAQINETQWRPTLQAQGELTSTLTRLTVDGNYEVRRFSQQTAQNTAIFVGAATLFAGTETSRFTAELDHNAEELLIDARLGDAPGNLDRRTFTQLTGGIRLGARQSQWRLNAHHSVIGFDATTQNNAEREGLVLLYDRGVSPVSRFGVELSGYQLEYVSPLDPNNAKFNYARAGLSWSTVLSNIDYAITLGHNRVDDGSMGSNTRGNNTRGNNSTANNGAGRDRRSSTPFYDIALNYSGDIHAIKTVFRQFITDTSQGTQNTGEPQAGNIDGRLEVVDQYKRRDALIEWRFKGICQLCSVMAAVGAQREDYRRATEFDNQEIFGILNVNFKRSRNASVAVNYRYADVSFQTNGLVAAKQTYTEQAFGIRLHLHRVFKRGNVQLYTEHIRRDSAQGNSAGINPFRARTLGLAFEYLLYRR